MINNDVNLNFNLDYQLFIYHKYNLRLKNVTNLIKKIYTYIIVLPEKRLITPHERDLEEIGIMFFYHVLQRSK